MLLFALTFITILGCGLVAGIFFAFSTFVMRALGELPPSKGIAAMQSINIVVMNPLFLGVFMGTTVACLLLIINAIVQWYATEITWMIVGGLFYIVGTFGVTATLHVPWNDELAEADPEHPESVQQWNEYLSKWTVWNHVRTIAALVAMASFIIALVRLGQG